MEDVVARGTQNPLARDLDEVLALTPGLWDDLRGARVFITGGTGFVGCWLLETFLRANDRSGLGASVVVLTRNADAFVEKAPHLVSHSALALHAGDMCSFDFPQGHFTHVIHAAVDTRAAGDREDLRREFESTIAGTRRVLEFARRSGASKFLFTSSGSVYGRQPPDLAHIPEEYSGAPAATNPNAAGAEAKRGAETLCALHSGPALATMIARCFTFVGPYLPLDGKFAVGNFIADALGGRPVCVSGDGTPYRSYLYAADLAVWLWTILLKGDSGRAYNVGAEDAITIGDLARAVIRVLAPQSTVALGATPEDGRAAARYVPSTARIRTELGVSATVGLDDALRRTAEWHRARRLAGARA